MNPIQPIQTLAIASGKGGVGKTQLALNLAMALAELERRVVLLDADLGMGDVAPLAGITPAQSLADVVAGRADLRQILLEGPGGIRIVPSPLGDNTLAELGAQQHGALIHGFNDLGRELDVLVVDTASGISTGVMNFVRASQEAIIVICNEAASVAKACALIRALNERRGVFRFRVVVNMARNAREARAAFTALSAACDTSLEVALHYLGHIPLDDNIKIAAQQQAPLLDIAPRSRAAHAIRSLAEQIIQFPVPTTPSGHLEFFVEQLVQTAH